MTVKTLEASTISAALAEARRLFGEDVVLLESHPPTDAHPARVSVAFEERPVLSADTESISRVIERVKMEPAQAFGYAGAGASIDFMVEDDAADVDDFSSSPSPRGRARGRLFPADGAPLRAVEPVGSRELTRNIEELLEQRLGTLHERLEGIERRFEGHPASAGKWLRHPLFNRLMDRGLTPQTVIDLFHSVTGHDEIEDDGALYWALVRSMRDMLQTSAPVQPLGQQVFLGLSGSGKTSLITRLATQRTFYGRRRCGVIIISPPSSDGLPRVDETGYYRSAGLPVQNVSKIEDMEPALRRLHGFDHILIDTPAVPFRPRPMRDTLAGLRPFIDQLIPAQVFYVLDATRALDELDPELLRRMPVAPDAIALTHMDETSKTGRVFDWLRRAELPVNLASSSSAMDGGLTTFSPAEFAEQLLSV